MEKSIVSNGVVDAAALDAALEPVEPYTIAPDAVTRLHRAQWWEFYSMGLVGALIGAALYFSAVTPWPGV